MFDNNFKKTSFSKKTIPEQLLEIFNFGVSSVQPKNILDKFIKVYEKNSSSRKNSKKKTYSKINKVYLICIGKASVDMANKIKDIFRTSNFKTQKGVLIVNEENFSKVKWV